MNRSLQIAVKADSRCSIISSVAKINELYAQFQGSKVYSSPLDCTSGYHHTALPDEGQIKSAFVTPTAKFEFKMVLFGLALAQVHSQQLIQETLKGLDFAFGYLDDILTAFKMDTCLLTMAIKTLIWQPPFLTCSPYWQVDISNKQPKTSSTISSRYFGKYSTKYHPKILKIFKW